MKLFKFIPFFLLLACSGSGSYSENEIVNMALELDPKFKFELPKTLSDGVHCYEYGKGCLGGKRARVKRVLVTIVEFKNEEYARHSAQSIDQYYAKNFVFDDVTGEPVLESFVAKAFGAVKANPN